MMRLLIFVLNILSLEFAENAKWRKILMVFIIQCLLTCGMCGLFLFLYNCFEESETQIFSLCCFFELIIDNYLNRTCSSTAPACVTL